MLAYVWSVKTKHVIPRKGSTYLDLVGILGADTSLCPRAAGSNLFLVRGSEGFGRGCCCFGSRVEEIDHIVLPVMIVMATKKPHLSLTDVFQILGD